MTSRAALASIVLCTLALGTALPAPVTAADKPRLGFDPWNAAAAPVDRALSGGTVMLKSPGTPMILVRRSTFRMGTTDIEVLTAKAECDLKVDRRGCDEQGFANALPARAVTVSSFWMDRLEVTVADYARCVAVGRCAPVPFAEGARRFNQPRFPVSGVTWNDAADYCVFRGARLPTEAEWERAASGPRHRAFPWGSTYNSHVANHGRGGLPYSVDPSALGPGAQPIVKLDPTDPADGYAELAPVGSFPAGRTADGFLDLGGNVAEWVRDWYVNQYPERDELDPVGPPTSPTNARAVRGGSYLTGAPWLRTTSRAAADPRTRDTSLGFRCARSASRRAEPR